MASTDEYAGLRQEEALKLYLKEERQMSQPDIDDFMNVYSTLSIEEVSELLFELIGKDIYRTCPVDMNTFITDPYFLGTIYGDSIFPVWKQLLSEVYPAPLCKAYEEIILSTATRCFGKGFKVLMADGSVKNIEHIVVGDKVMGADNKPKTVIALQHGIDQMYKVTPQDMRLNSFTCNQDHTLFLHKKPDEFVEISAKKYYQNISTENKDRYYRLWAKNLLGELFESETFLSSKFDIEPIGLGEYFGFTINDEKGLFLSNDGTFSHNCGKSTLIAISFAYEIMLMLCMINPAKTLLGKMSGSLVMAILSKDNQTAVSQVATDLYKILTLSPYFQSIIEGDLPFSNIEKKGVQVTDSVLLKAGSSLATLVGADLFACCLDEANIGTTKIAAEKLVETRLQLWQHAIDRRKATLDKAPAGTGIMLITSSPTEENDVIKARIDQVRNSGIPNVRIVDNLARWEARGTHATDTFNFFIGSDTKDPCLLEDVPDLILTPEEAKERVFKIPRTIEYLDAFRNEPIRAIQEMLGRRTNPENSFFRSVSAFERVFYKDNDIFSKDEIFLTLNGNIDLSDCLIDKEYFMHPHDPECYRYIHLDIASKQDRFGMASVYSKRLKFNSEEGIETSKRMYFVDFCLGLKARGGDAVDILKALDFIYQIKKQGYPVKLVTTDSHQGELSRQYLQKISNRTVKTDYQSVEKTKDAYFNLKNAILTEALVGYKNPILTKELKNLRETEKRVQKPTGNNYSDDMSDALAGALYSCTVDKYYMKTNEGVTDLITQFKSQQSYNRLYGKQSYNFRPFGM
jgi:hypothetical protein